MNNSIMFCEVIILTSRLIPPPVDTINTSCLSFKRRDSNILFSDVSIARQELLELLQCLVLGNFTTCEENFKTLVCIKY